MEYRFIFMIIFLNSLFFSFSIVQQWNFENSAKDLLSSGPASIKVLEETKDKLYVKLYKYLAIESGSVVYRKYLDVYYYDQLVYKGEVDFDKIESFHRFDSDNIICPDGKYNPTYFYKGNSENGEYSSLKTSDLPEFNDNEDWELKCATHEQGYFIVFYLMNGKSQLFYKYTGTTIWKKLITHDEIYDLKLGSKVSNNNEYLWAYMVKDGSEIYMRGSKFTIKSDYFDKNDCGITKKLVNARTHTRGCFENDFDHFYFLSYTDTSDFACGYWDSSNNFDYQNGQFSVTTNEESPIEFVDEVEIEHIRFMYNYKYAYYKIKNLANNKYYYGIIDTKKKYSSI